MFDATTTIVAPLQLDIEGIISRVYALLTGYTGDFESLYAVVSTWWFFFSLLSFMVSALLLIGTVYAIIRWTELRGKEDADLEEAHRAFRQTHGAADRNTRWQEVVAHSSSDSPNDWRIAIVEADIMLDELLEAQGYIGASVAEKLRGAQPETFRSIEDAWNAHKVRNAIAHQGSDFVLTKHVTQETITQYRHVFEEFGLV